MKYTPPRAFSFFPIALVLFSAACADLPRSVPTAAVAEAATLVARRTASLNGNLDVTGITIETRYWDPASGLPTTETAATTYSDLLTGAAGYTYPAVPVPNVGTAPSVLITADGCVTASPLRHPSAVKTNIATRISIKVNSIGESSIGLRVGVDARGAVVLVDGEPRVWNWGDSEFGEPSWDGIYLADMSETETPMWVANPWGVMEVLPLTLSNGPHTIEVIAFEDADDIGTGAQFDVGAGYHDIVGPIPQRNLAVSTIGVGAVASLPAGISCGADCAQAYDFGTAVTLTASATPPSVFAGWGGACSGTSTSCTLTMDADRAVTAKFVGVPTVTAMTLETRYWLRTGPQPTSATAATLFEGLPTDRVGYTNVPVRVAKIVNNPTLFTAPNVGVNEDLATRTIITLSTAHATVLTLRATVDYDAGGGIWLDNTLVTGAFGSAPDLLTATMNLTAGTHTITMLGFEGCCEFAPSLEFDYGTGSFQVTAPMPPPQTLTVTAGALGGRVTSVPAGIDCGTACVANFAAGSQVTLTAAVNPGYVFAGWSGGGCSGTGATCVVRMNSAQFVTASFIKNTLTVVRSGTGAGSVVSSPAGITCGATCAADFAFGEVVALTATPDGTSSLGAWSVPGCSGSTCTVTMQASRTVTISFVRRMAMLTVTKSGTGSGTVTSVPGGITCGSDCSENYIEGTGVTLTAAPTTGSTFTGWTGACTGTGTCTLPMSAAQSVNAEFTRLTATLTVTVTGTTGSGVVTSTPAGINCAMTTCTATFPQGTPVTLTPTPNAGSTFAGWSGACSGTGLCTVTMSAAMAVTAQFTKQTDTKPPTISCKADPRELWPVNHKMRDIRVSVTLTDAGSGANGFKLLSVESSEPENGRGDGNTGSDIAGWTLNTPDVTGQLRAERDGSRRDRVYTITYRGFDIAGNSATASCTVVVPHDQRGRDDHDDDRDDDRGKDKDKDKDKGKDKSNDKDGKKS